VAAAGIETIRARYTIDRILDLTERTFAAVLADHAARTPSATPATLNA
jgi:hypothetical protein